MSCARARSTVQACVGSRPASSGSQRRVGQPLVIDPITRHQATSTGAEIHVGVRSGVPEEREGWRQLGKERNRHWRAARRRWDSAGARRTSSGSAWRRVSLRAHEFLRELTRYGLRASETSTRMLS